MNTDYSEVLLEAMDIVGNSIIQGLKYDKTITATIVNDSEKKQGKYLLDDGNITFYAYSDSTNYKLKDSVQVVIPENNWDNTKIITGKTVNSYDNKPYNYISPLDRFLDIEKIIDEDNAPLSYNYQNSSSVLYSEIYDNNNYRYGYSALGLSAKFQTKDLENCISGDYGLQIIVTYADDSIDYGILNTKDMIGNVYQFSIADTQEKVFLLKADQGIKQIDVVPIKDNNFITKNGEQIESPQIIVSDIKLSLGFGIDEYKEDTLLLHTSSSLIYNILNQDQEQTDIIIQATWIHIIDDRPQIQTIDLNTQKIKWFRYELGAQTDDRFAGPFWKQQEEFGSQYLLTNLSKSVATEQVKAILYINGIDNIYRQAESVNTDFPYYYYFINAEGDYQQAITIEPGIVYYEKINIDPSTVLVSNVLTFINSQKPEIEFDDISKYINSLEIICADGSGGNYFRYDNTNRLIAPIENSRAYIYMNGSQLSQDDGYTFTWTIPSNDNTMLISKGFGDDYWEYNINNFLSIYKTNNMISCLVTNDTFGFSQTVYKNFLFGLGGSSGTDYTLIIIGSSSNQVGQSDINYTAKLFDKNNDIIDLTNYTVNWYYQNANGDEKTVLGSTFSLNNIQDINDCGILTATLSDFGDYDLTTSIAIGVSINNDGKNYFISGPLSIIKQTDGTLLYDNFSSYQLYENGKLIDENVAFSIKPEDQNALTINDKKNQLEANKINIDLNLLYILQGKINNNIVYQCPILILENRYFSPVINEWNGELLQDDKNNMMLARALAAGRKNSDNTFSGVLLGDVYDIVTNNNTPSFRKTGIFGFDNGVQSYSLTDDGKATFGVSGSGQILIDGTSAKLTSGNWYNENNSSGLMIDLDDGTIEIKNNNENVITLGRKIDNVNSPYLRISDTTGEKTLLSVGEQNNYYLQSKNYVSWNNTDDSISPAGSRFDLSTGNFEVISGIFNGDITIHPTNGDQIYHTYYLKPIQIAEVDGVPEYEYIIDEEDIDIEKVGSINLTSMLLGLKQAVSYSSVSMGKINSNIQKINSNINNINTILNYLNRCIKNYNDPSGFIDLSTGIDGNRHDAPGAGLYADRDEEQWGFIKCSISGATMGVVGGTGDEAEPRIWVTHDITGNKPKTFSGNIKWTGPSAGTGGSDKNLKTNIVYSMEKFEKLYDELKPAAFYYKDDLNVLHTGFIAQDIESSVLNNVDLINTNYLAQFNNDTNYRTVNYFDVVALNTAMIQKLRRENKELKQAIQEIKEKMYNE